MAGGYGSRSSGLAEGGGAAREGFIGSRTDRRSLSAHRAAGRVLGAANPVGG
jgi:hypothetical protein